MIGFCNLWVHRRYPSCRVRYRHGGYYAMVPLDSQHDIGLQQQTRPIVKKQQKAGRLLFFAQHKKHGCHH